MNSKWHAYISFVKSAVRIVSSIIALALREPKEAVIVIAIGFMVAEFLGIAEEIKDKR